MGRVLPAEIPYFAMEYVDGAPLTTFADERRLSVAERVGLLVDVRRGVEHAHRGGILHRDLKPGNVLVEDVEGHPTPGPSATSPTTTGDTYER